MELRDKRVTVVGLGIEGMALVPYLVAEGAQVTVSDSRSAEALANNLERLAGLPVQLSLDANRPEDCANADIVFASQGVPLDIPALEAARTNGVPICSATQLFLQRCPAPVIGITGSAGKTTTTTLIGEMLRSAGWPVSVGGNNGVMLLDRLDQLTPRDWVVLEMSHTQLELTDRSPHIALVTNISPSHADRYPQMDDYIALKERIFAFQGADDVLVLNWDDSVTRAMAGKAKGDVWRFTLGDNLPRNGTLLSDGWALLQRESERTRLVAMAESRLLGVHNVANVLAAAAAASAAGVPPEAIARAVHDFTGVEHRLEWVASQDGVDYYNDSIATTPERVVAGLRCFQRPIVLLAGGREKHLPLEDWAAEVGQRCAGVVFFGEAGPLLHEALEPGWQGREPLRRAEPLEEAVAIARLMAQPGDIVLLSPACTSFDQYPNFEARGRHFKQLVLAHEPVSSPEGGAQ